MIFGKYDEVTALRGRGADVGYGFGMVGFYSQRLSEWMSCVS